LPEYAQKMISLFLAAYITGSTTYARPPMTHRQVTAKAHRIVQMLKRQDPRVLRAVMYYMKWVPRVEFTRENCRQKTKNNNKDRLKKIDDWQMDMLLDAAGIPKPSSGPRSR
jgi:hypothetical protein